MRHRKSGTKLSKTSKHREAMFKNMVCSLFEYKQIKTTTPKAKALRGLVDKVITLAKVGDLHSRRQVLSIINNKEIVHKLFEKANDSFGHLNSGYTKIFKIGLRKGDAAPMSLVALYEKEVDVKGKKKEKIKDEKFIKEEELKKVENMPEEEPQIIETKTEESVDEEQDKKDAIKADEKSEIEKKEVAEAKEESKEEEESATETKEEGDKKEKS